MEKISGIIPANRRTKAVDVSNSQPVRPGAPTWGRPVGRVTQAMMPDPLEKVSFSQMEAKEGLESQLPQTTYNSRGQLSKSQVVEELSKKFFDPKIKALARDGDESLSEQVTARVNENEISTEQKSGSDETQRNSVRS